MSKILGKEFYERPPETVARELLGKTLMRRLGSETLQGKIVEVEAYLAEGDEAAHNYRGRDRRNESMYKTGGHIYVHPSRHHLLMDVVTETEDRPSTVLIRAVEPLAGIETMRKVRGTNVVENLASGPGKMCQAFLISKEMDGLDLTSDDSPLVILNAPLLPDEQIGVSTRIGISKAVEALLRFWIKDSSYVS